MAALCGGNARSVWILLWIAKMVLTVPDILVRKAERP